MSQDYPTNMLRAAVAHMQLANQMTAAMQMFSKGYFALSIAERIAVDQAVYNHLSVNYQQLTPEYFVGTQPATVGFLAGMTAPQAPATPANKDDRDKQDSKPS